MEVEYKFTGDVIMSKSTLLGALCVGVFSLMAISSSAFAVTADNVKCDKCVGTGDIAKKSVTASRIKSGAVTRSKIKDGAISKSKLSDDVLDLLQAAKRYVIVDSGDQIVGGIVGGDMGQPLIMTSQGYVAAMEVTDGKVSARIQVLYTGVDCSGTAYIDISNSLEGTETDGGYFLEQDETVVGGVLNVQHQGMLGIEYWYVPKTPTLSDNMPVQSVRLYDWNTESIECDAVSATITTALEIFPNDPAITGIPNTAFSAPLRYDSR